MSVTQRLIVDVLVRFIVTFLPFYLGRDLLCVCTVLHNCLLLVVFLLYSCVRYKKISRESLCGGFVL